MDFTQFREELIRKYVEGDREPMVQAFQEGNLTDQEKKFVVEILRGNPPKKKTGRKPDSAKAIKAALVRFWREYEDWNADAIQKEIETICGVKNTRARDLLKLADGQDEIGAQVNVALFFRAAVVASGNVDWILETRSRDLEPFYLKN